MTATVTILPASEAGGSAVILVPETVTKLVFEPCRTSVGLVKNEAKLMEFRVPAITGKMVPDGAALEAADAVLGANTEDEKLVTEEPPNGVLAEELDEVTTIKTKVRV